MTRAKRGNNNIACAAASLPLIIRGRGGEEEAGRGMKKERRLLGTQQRHCAGVDGQVAYLACPSPCDPPHSPSANPLA